MLGNENAYLFITAATEYRLLTSRSRSILIELLFIGLYNVGLAVFLAAKFHSKTWHRRIF